MTHHNHEHSGSGEHGHGHHGPHGRVPVHKDWRLWVGVVLMLAAMLVYILTQDESLVPRGRPTSAPASAPAAR